MARKRSIKILWQLFLIFFKAGSFTFAGGLAMLPVIEKDVVEKYKLMERDDFLEYATLSQTLPGVIALNCATLVGQRAAGLAGMLAAGFGATITAFLLMIAATAAMRFIPQAGPAMGAMQGIRAASSALILSAAFSLGRHNLKTRFAVIVMLMVFAAVLFFRLSAPLAVLGAGAAGLLYQKIKQKSTKGGQSK